MNDFFKGFKMNRSFLGSSRDMLSSKRTVCVKHKDGRISEHADITDPWRYIVKVKKNLNVVTAWIKED